MFTTPFCSRAGRKPYRPTLEAFEDRLVLSTVTNLGDNGPGSLRAAIALAEFGETIDFAEGLTGTITLTTGQLTLTQDVSIVGPGQGLLTVNGNGASCGQNTCDRRVFDIAPGVNVSLSGLTIAGGSQVTPVATNDDVYAFGGGIYNAGNLYLTDATVAGNLAWVRANNNSGRLLTANSHGGGLFNSGNAVIVRSTFVDNTATFQWAITGNSRMQSDGYGGAIDNAGTLFLLDSTIGAANRPNTGVGYGGGLHNSGQAVVFGSTFFNNLCPNGAGGNIPGLTRYSHGGAIANIRGVLTVVNSTIAGNTAVNGLSSPGGLSVSSGGGIYSQGDTYLINTTVANNRLSANGTGGANGLGRGAGIFVDPSSPHGLRLINTVVANNAFFTDGGTATFTGPDAFGRYVSQGNNLIGRTDGGTGWTAADLTGTIANPLNARLGALGNWGGPTQTMRPLCDSPLLDAGSFGGAGDFDQRGDGYLRLVGYYDPENPVSDIGAFEVQSVEDCEPISGPYDGAIQPWLLPAADLVQVLELAQPRRNR